MLDFITN
jgi:hypothetical protein